MNPYSLDLRERVIAALRETTASQAQVARQFKISLATIENWWRQWRETGSVVPRPHASGPARTLQSCTAIIGDALKLQPDATLAELCAQVETKSGVRSSASMMCRELQHLHLPRKKVTA